MTGHKQTTDGVVYGNGTTDKPMTYTYNLSGAMVEQQYPSGRVVKNVLNSNGDLSTVQSKKNANSGNFNYTKNFTYNAAGAVSSMRLGNGKWESTQFNSRLQPTQIALGTTQNGTDKLKLNYDYGTTANNGNILSQTITVPTVGSNPGFTATQNYTYDSLNRLKDATETIGGAQSWKQTFTFDRYGNRNFDQANTTMPSSFSNPAVSNPTISTANNRITSTGWLYDAAGNTTRDGNYQTFTYDAENKQTEVKNSSSVSLGQYWYDGDGRRVKKYVPSTGETTIFVYDASGKTIAEYSTVVEGSSTAKVSYLTNDHLGSPRITTDANGAVISRRDFHPFGEEVFTAQRTQGLGYSADTIRQKFTAYERDVESGLDFAQARMYGSSLGRFSTADPLMASAHTKNPQTWNRYIYVGNNPIVITDAGGLDWYHQTRDGRTFYQWSDDNKSFKDGSTVDGWNAVEFNFTGKLFYKGCSDAECNSTKDVVLYKNGGYDFVNSFSYDLRSYEEETLRDFLSFDPVQATRHDFNYIMSDPLGEPGLGNPGLAFVTGGLATGLQNFSKVATAASEEAQVVQYSLRAVEDGMYPVMKRGFKEPVGSIFLKADEVWKFGQTINSETRYSGIFLRNNGLQLIQEGPATSLKQALVTEAQKILQYENQFGKLPPGNKIRR